MKYASPIRLVSLALIALLGFQYDTATASLRLDYTVSSVGGGLYQYDFELTLDNHDGNWTPGQEWDWIVFGDEAGDGSTLGFGRHTASGGTGSTNWSFLTVPSGFNAIGSGGGHNGPTLSFGGSPTLPGWSPTAVGESIAWSGTEDTFLPDGQLYWSTLVTNAGTTGFDFELGHEQGGAVPEATSFIVWALLSLGAIGIKTRTRT